MAEIVSLHDGVIAHGKPSKSVIDLAREILRQAEAGEIIALGCASIEPSLVPSTSWACEDDRASFVLIGCVSRLQYRLNAGQDR